VHCRHQCVGSACALQAARTAMPTGQTPSSEITLESPWWPLHAQVVRVFNIALIWC